MAKSAYQRSGRSSDGVAGGAPSFVASTNAFDSGLASLFASSAGPVEAPSKSRYQAVVEKKKKIEPSSDEEDEATSGTESEALDSTDSNTDPDALEDGSKAEKSESDLEDVHVETPESLTPGQDRRKKRKRTETEDDIENVYMQKLAREEEKNEEKRKKQKTKAALTNAPEQVVKTSEVVASDLESGDESYTIPKHETLAGSNDDEAQELEKAGRSVFLGNVSNEAITSKAAEKHLKQHLSSFLSGLADNKPPHKVESIRFRSTAFAGALPKRAAFAKKETMDSTTKSTNAYAVYTTKTAAREAVKRLNGTIILGRHLRVDSVAHPAKVDHRRCVFVGNLGFVDDDSKQGEDGEAKKKSKPAGDVEEGLWVQFSKAGTVESVRVPRDAKTRVGKGFAYVQFADENGVEAALQFNDHRYPPLLPRKLRVVRARAQKKAPTAAAKPAAPQRSGPSQPSKSKSGYTAKLSEAQKSAQGRARAVLGKAAKFKAAESFVFEGHRASSKQGTSGLKLGGKARKKGGNGRSARSKAWREKGGKR